MINEGVEQQQKLINDQEQNFAKREFKKRKKEVLQKASKNIQKKLVEKIGKRAATRGASWAAGATGVGLIVTYGIWTVQAIAGNLMGSKIIPKLDWWELILWGILGILLFVILIFIFMLVGVLADPTGFALSLVSGIWESVVSFFSS